MGAEMDQRVGAETLADELVDRQVEMVRRHRAVVVGLARTAGTRRLRQQQQITQARRREHEASLAVDIAQGPMSTRVAPARAHLLAQIRRQRLEPVQVGVQRQARGEAVAIQRVQGLRPVVAAEQALGGIDQRAFVARRNPVAGRPQRFAETGQAGRYIEMRGGDVLLALRVVPEHQRQVLVRRRQATQAQQPVELVQQGLGLPGHQLRLAVLQGADHQRIAHSPGFRHAEEGRRGTRRHPAGGGQPVGLVAVAVAEGLQYRHVQREELGTARRAVLQVLQVDQRLDIGASEGLPQRLRIAVVEPHRQRRLAVPLATPQQFVDGAGLGVGDGAARDQEGDARGIAGPARGAPGEVVGEAGERRRCVGMIEAGLRQGLRRRQRVDGQAGMPASDRLEQPAQVGFAAVRVVADQAPAQRRRQVAEARRTAADADPGLRPALQALAQRLLDLGAIGRPRRVEDQQVAAVQPLAGRRLADAEAQAAQLDTGLARPTG